MDRWSSKGEHVKKAQYIVGQCKSDKEPHAEVYFHDHEKDFGWSAQVRYIELVNKYNVVSTLHEWMKEGLHIGTFEGSNGTSSRPSDFAQAKAFNQELIECIKVLGGKINYIDQHNKVAHITPGQVNELMLCV